MKKITLSLIVTSLLAACGDTVENTTVNQMGMSVVATEDDLPECTEDSEGDQVFVKDEASARICVDGDWVAMNGSGSADFSCTTKELKDKSGLKIICNGDSIGVVLNGEKGEKGDAGENGKKGDKGDTGKSGEEGSGCTVTQTDSTITVVAVKTRLPLNSAQEKLSTIAMPFRWIPWLAIRRRGLSSRAPRFICTSLTTARRSSRPTVTSRAT